MCLFSPWDTDPIGLLFCVFYGWQGVRAVIAESFEKMHKNHLVGMGIAPLQFLPGQSADSLELCGKEKFTITLPEDLSPKQMLTVKVWHPIKCYLFITQISHPQLKCLTTIFVHGIVSSLTYIFPFFLSRLALERPSVWRLCLTTRWMWPFTGMAGCCDTWLEPCSRLDHFILTLL